MDSSLGGVSSPQSSPELSTFREPCTKLIPHYCSMPRRLILGEIFPKLAGQFA